MRSIIFCLILVMSNSSFSAKLIIEASSDEAIQALKMKNKQVLTFVGYSGKGYKDLKQAMVVAKNVLKKFKPQSTIVNIGVTPEGIGQIYCIAKKMGFETSGIVSSKGREYITDESTSCVDIAFIIEDASWGGKLEDGTLSPTSNAMVFSSDLMVRLGGGQIAIDEASFAKSSGIKVKEIEMEAGTKQNSEKYLDDQK